MRIAILLLLSSPALLLAQSSPVALDAGVVVAPEPLAAEVGAAVLRRGGNAADATVAVHFALAVTFPAAGNLGGGGFLLVRDGEDVQALDFRERAPAAAGPELFQDAEGNVVPGLSLWSHVAAGVPGSVAGMAELHARHGSLPWAELVAPAILLARDGFELSPELARGFASMTLHTATLTERYSGVANFGDFFAGEAGETFRQPLLAATLGRIAELGSDGFYKGKTAELLIAEMKRGEGLITLADLAAYEATWRTPVGGSYRGHAVYSMPPPSSGGIALVQLLSMLESLGDVPPLHSAEHIHRVCEIEKRVFADRAHFLGDTDFHPVPTAALIDPEYCRARAAEVNAKARTAPDTIAHGKPVRPAKKESEETTHYSIVDAEGMAISCTTTLNTGFGTGLVVEGAGFLLNNEMDDFAAKAGVPNVYGVTGAEANQVEGGKRMLSSMSPTLVFNPEGELWLVVGTPGGPTIFTSVFQVIVNRIDFDLPLQEAVNAVRFHHQWPPVDPEEDVLLIDGELPEETQQALEELGYALRRRTGLGDIQAIEIGDGAAHGAPDRRGRGAVATAARKGAREPAPK